MFRVASAIALLAWSGACTGDVVVESDAGVAGRDGGVAERDGGVTESDGGPSCGDGVCNGRETCSTCSTDCRTCPDSTGIQAGKADDLVEFLSVQTHANWGTPLWSPTEWRAKLGALGVRYSRGGWANPQARDHLRALYSQYGIRASQTFSFPVYRNLDDEATYGTFDFAWTDRTLDNLRDHAGLEKLIAIEGPNEYQNDYKAERRVHITLASPGTFTSTDQGFVGQSFSGPEPYTFQTAEHHLAVGDRVQFWSTGTLPSPLATYREYVVVAVPSATTFRISDSPGGTPIATTGPQSGDHYLQYWPPRLRQYQSYLWNHVTGTDPAYVAAFDAGLLTVVGYSVWGRVVADYEAVGAGGSSFFERVNLHLYNGARRPSRYRGDSGDDPVLEAIRDAQIMGPQHEVWITETGFNIANDAQPGNVSTTTEEIASKYILRLICEYWLIRETGPVGLMNYYSLLDDPATGNEFGLMEFTSPDGVPTYTERRHYWSLRNLIHLLREATWSPAAQTWTYADFTPGRLDFELATSNPDIKHFVLQKSDGRFYILVWHDAVSWRRSPTPGEELDVPRETATLTVVSPAFSQMNVFEPTVLGSDDPDAKRDVPVQTSSTPGQTTELSIPDHVVVVELIP